jgi:hypothetical protein
VNDTIRILKDGRNQGYMQVCLTFQIESPIETAMSQKVSAAAGFCGKTGALKMLF